MLLELEKGKKTVGRKQSQRAILEGKAEKVFLADDADERIRCSCMNRAAGHRLAHAVGDLQGIIALQTFDQQRGIF